MSQRKSEYARRERDLYETPEWVTEALIDHLPRITGQVWEPAAGNGRMAAVLARHFNIIASDIELPQVGVPCLGGERITQMLVPGVGPIYRHDFFHAPLTDAGAIITNPPFSQGICTRFVERAIGLVQGRLGVVAILQRVDWDSAITRSHLFADHPAWARKLVLRRRIAWFVEANGKPKASPSENHAWYIWDWLHRGPPQIAYAP